MNGEATFTDPANQPGGGGSQPFGKVTASNVTVAQFDPIPFVTVVADADGYWDAANHQFVVPAGKGGMYQAGTLVECNLATGLPFCAVVATSGDASNLVSDLPDDGVDHAAGSTIGFIELADGDSLFTRLSWAGVATPATVGAAAMWFVRIGDLAP